MAKQSFMRGAMVLGTASVSTKILGMIIQVVVARELGASGFGLFRSVNPIFYMLLTISTLALPPALSKVIAENLALGNLAKIRRALKISNTTVTVLSVVFCVGAIALSPVISAKWLDPRAFLPFVGALIRMPLVCLSSIMTGYYMGIQNQTPPAIAWILETAVRTLVTIPLILLMNPHGIAYGALAVMIGAAVGEGAGYLYMLWCYYRRDRQLVYNDSATAQLARPELLKGTVRDLVDIAAPTTIRNILGIMAYAAQPFIVYYAFAKAGIAKMDATSLYGSFEMGIQLLLLPTVFSSSLSSVIIPAVSEAAAMRNARLVSRRLYQVIQVTFLIAFPATAFFLLSGNDLATSLYRDHLAGNVLVYIAPICVFMYIRDPLSAILQGLNKATLSAAISLFTSGIRMYCIYYFVSQPGDGVYGIAKATAITAIVSALLHLWFVRKYVSISINVGNLVKMMISTVMATLVIHQIHASLAAVSPVIQVVLSVLLGGVVYFGALLYFKVIRVGMIERIPWIGYPISRILRMLRFI